MNTLAAVATPRAGDRVGWDEYVYSASRELDELDDAIFEMSYLVATLTAVDGAVVMTRNLELIGFGGEIAGALSEIQSVAHVLDLEGLTYKIEPTQDVGTRHRSVYRLCNALPEVLGIVVSQDATTRFVRRTGPHVMYWEHSTVIPH